jgi:hypothetical protein
MILIIVTVMIFVILLSLTLINTLRIGSIKDEQVDFMNKINNTLSRVHNELLSKYEEKKSIDSKIIQIMVEKLLELENKLNVLN